MKKNITTDINFATKLLKDGALVAFPTETVYGLGADANNPDAIKKVFNLKGRPADHPLIVHLATASQLPLWARDIPQTAWQVAEHFWPGPLTLILLKQEQVSPLITGGQDTIALRIPNHPIALQLLQNFGSGLVGPSANKYGRVSPTSAMHVAMDLGNNVNAILDGGESNIGIESTILNLTGSKPMIMRSGAITAAAISAVLGEEVVYNSDHKPQIRTSGSHESHYAPVTKVSLLNINEILNTIKNLPLQTKFSVISFNDRPTDLDSAIYWQQVAIDPVPYAHNLYANLRNHDLLNNSLILIEKPPTNEQWLAILDRLTRASS